MSMMFMSPGLMSQQQQQQQHYTQCTTMAPSTAQQVEAFFTLQSVLGIPSKKSFQDILNHGIGFRMSKT